MGGEVGGALLLVAESLPARAARVLDRVADDRRRRGQPARRRACSRCSASRLSETAFAAWGWRLAFLASGVLIAVGIWIRRRVDESPLYLAYVARRAGQPAADARATTLAAHWRSVLTVLLVKCGENALFYVFTTFFVVYVTRVLHRPRTLALEGAAVGVDRRDRRRSSRRARCPIASGGGR